MKNPTRRHRCCDCEELIPRDSLYNRTPSTDGQWRCDSCDNEFWNETHDPCPVCGYEVASEKYGEIGTVLVVHRRDILEPTGTYEIVEHPFCADGMIEGHLYRSALRLVSRKRACEMEGRFPVSLVCPACSEKIKKAAAAGQEVPK